MPLNKSNILIAGGAGFIGSALIEHIVARYPSYVIICFDCLSYCSQLKNIEPYLSDNVIFVKGDITNKIALKSALVNYDINVVINLAANTHVDLSLEIPFDFTNVNVIGTQVILECLRERSVDLYLHMSTDEVYGDSYCNTSNAPLEPTNPYSASKAAADMFVHAYMKSFNLPAIFMRTNNVYGPRQFPEKLIPKTIMSLLRGSKVPLHGSGLNQRRYIHCTDLATAIDLILHNGQIASVYNIGSETELSNIDVCRTIIKAMPSLSEQKLEDLIEFTKDRPYNDSRYFMNSSLIESLGWKPHVSFESGLADTIAWYEANSSDWWGPITEYALQAFPRYPSSLLHQNKI
ncbi:hypothetical protein CANCADRAFT_21605 [Tortispora caseinolytica NRRL Y-17796]|uniref:NAD(P)-binding domain-containing protein n=1 Tax=Tortispora caseinolytica NRRL Y-17796 TaxID=767744 RepID=A0A1E4TL87_9ASCO|nr:hypothetical protein CANCADRAFT_21605 [Tortispora caseinolytica NRRL Y-17796]